MSHTEPNSGRGKGARALPRVGGSERTGDSDQKLIVLGASTGGVEAIETVLHGWPADGPPVVIVQHMPTNILEHFADRLNRFAPPTVTLAYSGQPIEAGTVYIAPGGTFHLEVIRKRTGLVAHLVSGDLVSGHRPSVDRLFQSALPLAAHVVAVLLTGMGRDGAQGMLALHQAGAWTIAQDQQSSVVYGMPAAAKRLQAVSETRPLDQIARACLAAARGKPGKVRRSLTEGGAL